jgi:thiamine biosynthesis protein ThiI
MAYKVTSDIDEILDKAALIVGEKLKYKEKRTSFRISSRRGDKTFRFDSMELNNILGKHLLNEFGEKLSVDLNSPELTVFVEVRDSTYIYTDKSEGTGGLPVGTGGRAMLLLSGGIDSPVAGYLVSKRGVKIEAIHFHSYPYTSERSRMKVIELAKIIGGYNNGIYLHVIPFTDIQLYLRDNFDMEYLTILMRRIMMRIAEMVAAETSCNALITGESIGQVASQTLHSLSVTDSVVDLLVIRPLITSDKNDIVDLARKIDTYETSILPYEDCCTLFVAKHPKTKPRLADILDIEAKYDNISEMMKNAVTTREVIGL